MRAPSTSNQSPRNRRVVALPELAHDLDRLLEHRDALVGRGPADAGDVLVQVLAGADAEEEAAGPHHRRARRRGLRDDRRVDADQRAGDARAEPEALGRLRDAADHAPDERALALRVVPRVEVVGDQAEREAGLLGELRVAHHVVRRCSSEEKA